MNRPLRQPEPRVVSLVVDQGLSIGSTIRLHCTDIDPAGVRFVAAGEYVGGHDDGGGFRLTQELGVGHAFDFGSAVRVQLLGTQGGVATMSILAPAHLGIMVDPRPKV